MITKGYITLTKDISIKNFPGREYQLWPTKNTYQKGDKILVERATNLPDDSDIVFWIVQDNWNMCPYGFPVYKDQCKYIPA